MVLTWQNIILYLYLIVCVSIFSFWVHCVLGVHISKGKAEAIAQAVCRGVGKKGKPRKGNPICLISEKEKIDKMRYPSLSIFVHKKVANKKEKAHNSYVSFKSW